MKYIALRRILVNEPITKSSILSIISRDKLHHLSVVLKLKKSEPIKVFNQVDGEWLGIVQDISKKKILIEVKEQLRKTEASSNVKIAFAPIKYDRLRFLVEKCTEIGTDAFIPVLTDRTTSPYIKLDKLNTYIVSAVEQSDRIRIPCVKDSISLEEFLNGNKSTTILACLERIQSHFISEVVQSFPKYIGCVLLVGPEGGFSEKEICLLNSQENVRIVSLGGNVLRSETAAIFALSCVMSARYRVEG